MKKNTVKPMVVVEDIVKSFQIPLEGSSGLKQKLINHLKGKKGYRVFTPLNGISFTVNEGDFFGIVGKNGSGKSTLLKTLAGIYTPQKGNVHINGSLVPFIELGVGFNPELSGRENVYLNGALLGFSHQEVALMYDDIVDFAELHDFMEERLKNYSSGMQVRLAFSIAIKAKGDILLLDEVLAVGDEAFQRKCYAYFDELKRTNKTVILVTHDMGAVQRFCTKALFLNDGYVEAIGKPDDIANQYTKRNDIAYAEYVDHEAEKDEHDAAGFSLVIKNGRGEKVKRFYEDEEITVEIAWTYETVSHVGVALVDDAGRDIFSPNTYNEKRVRVEGKEIKYTVKANLIPGGYSFKAALFGKHDKDIIDRLIEGPRFIIEKNPKKSVYVGVTELEHSWYEKK